MNHNIINEYKKHLNIENYDVIFALDNTGQQFSDSEDYIQELEFYGVKVKCLLFNEKLNNDLKLPYYPDFEDVNFAKIMWYNCDYPFYYVKHFFPEYDFYWQIEFDIFCNGDSYCYFFDEHNNNVDFIATYVDKVNSLDWPWAQKTNWYYKDIQLYRCFYPIVRLSSAAVDFLYNKRLELGSKYALSDDKDKRWLHCEVFTATELINNHFSYKCIENQHIHLEEYDITDDIFTTRDNKLYHPVKYNYVRRMKKLEAENLQISKELQYIKSQTGVNNIFSVQNSYDKSHKIITIFGIRIKFRRNNHD